jgi:glyoxylase-like metal-dependent hydrolase (beta-lactamase superfamily II)
MLFKPYAAVLLMLAAPLSVHAQEAIPVSSSTHQIGPGLYTFTHGAARNIFLVTEEGVIVTDPISSEAASLLMAEVRAITDQPIKFVVYSHQHWDHIKGGQIFKDAGATFISHHNCMKHFHRHPNPAVVKPDLTFEGPRYELTLGGRTLELLFFGRNHGDCMVVMRIPEQKALFMVDLVSPGGVSGGTGWMNDYYPVDYIRSLREIEDTVDFDVMIGGHGAPIAPKAAVTERRRYLEALMAAVKAEIDNGTPRDQLLDTIDLPEFRHLRNYDTHMKRNAERMRMYYAIGW